MIIIKHKENKMAFVKVFLNYPYFKNLTSSVLIFYTGCNLANIKKENDLANYWICLTKKNLTPQIFNLINTVE